MTTPYQDKADSGGVPTNNEDGGVNLSPHPSTFSGENELNSLCNSSCSSILLKLADGSL